MICCPHSRCPADHGSAGFHRFYVLGEDSHIGRSFQNDRNGTLLTDWSSRSGQRIQRLYMGDRQEFFATLLGRAVMDVWGDMPRDIQEALFETAMKGQDVEREELARLLHSPHPRTLHPTKPS
jgi:hypothetical protein